MFQAPFQKSKMLNASAILSKLAKYLCEKATELELSATVEILKRPLLLAVELGNKEVVEGIVASFPPALRFTDQENHNVLHLAVKHRQPDVFKLIRRTYECKQLITATFGEYGDNILHFAARAPPVNRLESFTSPAMQMHEEAVWFQAVKTLVPPSYESEKNIEGKTPRMLLQETHRNLITAGQKWMKDVTIACSVVAALIPTITFAAAITVPGGVGNNGNPVLYKQPAFVIFAISNAVSFLLSTWALNNFIQTQFVTCTDEAFLVALPVKLVRLFSLRVDSLRSTTISFFAANYLLAVENRILTFIIIPYGIAQIICVFSLSIVFSSFRRKYYRM